MPLPFRKVFRRRPVRRVLLPFTIGLFLIAFFAFSRIGY